MGMPQITVKKVNKTFEGENRVYALADVNLEIGDGEFVCILGPSGCGKSTLLEIMAGLQTSSSGHVLIGDNEVKGPSRDIGVVFQDSSLFPWRTVLENIEFGLKIKGLKRAERLKIVREYIQMVSLNGFENQYPRQLSGGMRQRAGLARTLACQPKVLLMDEPFGAVDYLTRLQLQSDVTRIWEKHKKTVVFVTHDVTESVFLADRVVVFSPRPGRIREIFNVPLARPREYNNPALLEIQERIYRVLNTSDSLSSMDYTI
jgi:NitT/TauT family transport system ATP-binding protein